MSFETCTEVNELCPVEDTLYGYVPNYPANLILCLIFAVCLLPQFVLGIWSRAWTFTIALAIGCFMEALGYAGRLLMHENVWNKTGFEMQIILLVVGPSFIAAGVYLTLKHIIIYLGAEYSLLKPHLYTWIFIGCDMCSIVLQLAGSGIAAADSSDIQTMNMGNYLIIAGIAFQIATMVACGILALDFTLRYRRRGRSVPRPSEEELIPVITRRKLQIFCVAEIIAYVAIMTRCIYRLPELAGGWGNPLMRIEAEFLVLDGAMTAIAVIVLTIFHPSSWFPPVTRRGQKKLELQARKREAEESDAQSYF